MASFQSDFRRREGRLAAPGSRVSPLRAYVLTALGGLGALLYAQSLLMPEATDVAVFISAVFYTVMTVLFGGLLSATYPHAVLGLCNVVTLGRLVLVSALVTPLFFDGASAWLVVGLSAVVLALDGVDGWLARRSNLVSGFGARFDVEVNSAFALILTVHALIDGSAGPIVSPRPCALCLCLAGLTLPWLNGPLPERFSREAVSSATPRPDRAADFPSSLPPLSTVLVISIAAAAVLWSFGTTSSRSDGRAHDLARRPLTGRLGGHSPSGSDQPNHPAAFAWDTLLLFPLELRSCLLGLAAAGPGRIADDPAHPDRLGADGDRRRQAADFAMFTALGRGFDPVCRPCPSSPR